MANNRRHENERNPFKVVLYILIVLMLLGCIGFLYYRNKERQAAYREEIEEMASYETEYIRTERMTETETEKQTEKKQTEKKQAETKAAADAKNADADSEGESESESESKNISAGDQKDLEPESETEVLTESESETGSEAETESESETGSETETESESETESELKAGKSAQGRLSSIKIVVLNASGREGAAGMWKNELEKDGYKNISAGSYSHKEEGTTIYTKNAALGEDLKSIFPNSNVYEDGIAEVRAEIEFADTVKNALTADAYIVVGKNNTEIF
mgnify:CR=1 FL=1